MTCATHSNICMHSIRHKIAWIACFTHQSLVDLIEYALPVWGGYLNAALTRQINSFPAQVLQIWILQCCCYKVEQLLTKSDQNMFWAIQNVKHCSLHSHPATSLPPSKDSDRSFRPRGHSHNYQLLPVVTRKLHHQSFIPVPFSNMYDHSVLVLGIVSALRTLKVHFVFLLFLFMCSSFSSLLFKFVHTRLLCVFYPNVTTLRSGLCCRNSVCLPVCRLSVTLVHPAHGGWSFRQYFFTAVYAGHPLTSVQNFTEIVPGEPSVGSVKRKRGIKKQRFRTYRRLYHINSTR